ncbi:ATP-dependent Clp protease proteolytic subunit [Roseateles sp. P5_E4]
MSEVSFTVNWSRCVYINKRIDDDLLNELLPHIFQLRKESNEPITVAINSHGGSVAAMEAILRLITGPDQDGNVCDAITVATNRVSSAAAMLLCLGNYAVGLEESKLLYHDVRYGLLDDVTPTTALAAAQELQRSNDIASTKIAHSMFHRWMWAYIDLKFKIEEAVKRNPSEANAFREIVDACRLPQSDDFKFDLAGLATTIFSYLHPKNECLIVNAMNKLHMWGAIMHRTKMDRFGDLASGTLGRLDGLSKIFGEISSTPPEHPFGSKANEDDLDLLVLLVIGHLQPTENIGRNNFQAAMKDFAVLKTIEDPSHQFAAFRLMLRHKHTFFAPDIVNSWENMGDEKRQELMSAAAPIVKAVWLLCVLVARELFNGEHTLSCKEALVLGIIDEAPGIELFETRRQFSKKMSTQAS